MKVVYNYIIPFKGYLAITIFPFIFARKDVRELNRVDINHETIHGKQQVETHCAILVLSVLLASLGIFSFWWILCTPLVYFALYGLEYLIRFVLYGFDTKRAYKNVSFEQEAYENEVDFNYVLNRKPFAWLKYVFKNKF